MKLERRAGLWVRNGTHSKLDGEGRPVAGQPVRRAQGQGSPDWCEMQIGGAKLGGLFNMGGAAVANYVSILEPLR